MNANSTTLKSIIAAAAAMIVASFAGAAQPQSAANPRDFKAFQLITERNIFDPNRRAITERPPPPKVVDSFALTGTMNYPKGVFAFFDGTRSDFNHVLEAGGKIAGFTVTDIGHDVVKLVQDTNVLELKVGMQMRRSADGKWTAGEAATGSYGYSSAVTASHFSGRQDRRSNRNGGRMEFGNGYRMPQGGGFGRATAGETSQMSSAPAEAGTLDPTDPVARLMLRRLQETGGVPNQSETPNEEPSNQNESVNIQSEPVPTTEAPNAPDNRPANGTDNPNQANEN